MDATQHRLMQSACRDFAMMAAAACVVAFIVGVINRDWTTFAATGLGFFGAWFGNRQADYHAALAGPPIDKDSGRPPLLRLFPVVIPMLFQAAFLLVALAHVEVILSWISPINMFVRTHWELWLASGDNALLHLGIASLPCLGLVMAAWKLTDVVGDLGNLLATIVIKAARRG